MPFQDQHNAVALFDAVRGEHGRRPVAFAGDIGKGIGLLFEIIGEVQHRAFVGVRARQLVDHIVSEIEMRRDMIPEMRQAAVSVERLVKILFVKRRNAVAVNRHIFHH